MSSKVNYHRFSYESNPAPLFYKTLVENYQQKGSKATLISLNTATKLNYDTAYSILLSDTHKLLLDCQSYKWYVELRRVTVTSFS